VAARGDDRPRTLYSGTDTRGWMIAPGHPVPAKNAQPDGLNPHDSGGYIIVYESPYTDFVLDFEYKLTKGCNSGVFIRVGDLKDPVMTGLEIAIDDTTGHGLHDPGALYDLQAPVKNTQKPVGAWNHMTVSAKGPIVTIELNGETVNTVDLSKFTEPGKRPDGSSHKFSGVAIKNLEQKGYLGFQDHGSDCWFRKITLTGER
jgi:hypothetical protein